MSAIIARNKVSGETYYYNTFDDPFEFNNFCRKAVLDFIYGDDRDCSVLVGENKYLTVNSDTPEPMKWFAACVLYMYCVEHNNWDNILDIYEVSDDEEEDE